MWGSLHATGSASPPTSHEFYIVLGVKTQTHTQIQIESSSHPQEENAPFIQLNPGLNTFGPGVASPLSARGEIKVLRAWCQWQELPGRGYRAGNPDRQIRGDSGRL